MSTHFSKGAKTFLWGFEPLVTGLIKTKSSHFRKCCEKNFICEHWRKSCTTVE